MKKIKYNKLMPSAWAEINLSSIASNYKLIKGIIGPRCKIMAVVKANAYGHGLIPVSLRLSKLGVDYLAVATISEALSLRKAKIKGPILVLNTVSDGHLDYLFGHNITIAISDMRQAKILNAKAKAFNKQIKVHIEIDTGMGRTGLWYKQAKEAVKEIVDSPFLDAEGIFTHFSCADSDISFTNKQITNFKNLLTSFKQGGICFKLTHAANSAGIVNSGDSGLNMARPGLMLYGLSWDKEVGKILGLRPAMTFKTRIVFLKRVYPGRCISYGRTYIAKSPRLIATLACGYADGYNRFLSGKADVIIRGKRAKVIGRVCMDNTMVDVTSIKGIKLGDEVVLFGASGKEPILAEELASLCRTIAYEIVCWVSKRVRRIYIN